MGLKKGRRALVGGLALTGIGAGTVTGLISSSARGAEEASVASKTAGFGWEIVDLNNNGADVYLEVASSMTLIAVDIDAAFTITSAPASPGLAEVLCRATVSRGSPKFVEGEPSAPALSPASANFGRLQIYNPHDLNIGADGFALQDVLCSVIVKTWVPASGTASGASRHVRATPSLALDAREYLVFHMDHAGVPGDAEMQVVLDLIKQGLLNAGLLGRNGADQRELVPLPVVSLVHAEQPDQEPQQADEPANRRENEPDHVKDCSHDPEPDAQGNGQSNPGGAEQDGLERVEAHERPLAVRFQHEEQDAGNETNQVAKGSGDVVFHARPGRSAGRRRRGTGPRGGTARRSFDRCSTLRAEPSLHWSSTTRTEWHRLPPEVLYIKPIRLASQLLQLLRAPPAGPAGSEVTLRGLRP